MEYGPQVEDSDRTHAEKYRQPGETFRERMAAIANHLKDDDKSFRELYEFLLDMSWLPAGRVQAACGTSKNVTAHNCFVSAEIHDSFTDGPDQWEKDAAFQSGRWPSVSIMDSAKMAAQTMRQGGGIGYDFSTMRPSGDLIVGVQARTDGPIAFAPIHNAVCQATSSSGNRRGAQMMVMRVDHPDIRKFILAKNDSSSLSGFNMSVAITDEFMRAVADDTDYDLKFGGRVYRHEKARDIWNMIIRSAYDYAEPGVLFIDTINRMNNLYYCETIAATNPCVTGDTLILTDRGHVEIEDLVGQKVRVWNGESFSEVEPKVTGRDQKMLRITTSDGRYVDCTLYHRFPMLDGSVKEARELLIDDELETCDWPVIATVDRSDDEDDAYTQGFFSGDGWEDSRGRQYVGLYQDKKDLLSHLSQDFKSVKRYESKDGSDRLFVYYGRDRLKRKSYVPSVDKSVTYRLRWLAGLIDSDGYVTKPKNTENGGHLQISNKSREFCLSVSRMMDTLGIRSRVSCSRVSDWRVISPASQVFRLSVPTKRVEFRESSWTNRFKLSISSIEEIEDAETVYCFTESKRSRGVFNGLLLHQCGEQPLPPHGSCLLGSLNLVRLLNVDRTDLDWDKVERVCRVAVRSLDNVIDRCRYPLPEQEVEAKQKRRMGIGVTGVANALEVCGLPYGTQEAVKRLGSWMKRITHLLYDESVEMAIVKGPFPRFDRDAYCSGNFVKRLEPWLQEKIRRYGIRNSHLTSIAPTGTISYCADNVSSGIEPVFAEQYDRDVITEDGKKTFRVMDYGLRYFGVSPRSADQVHPLEHVAMMTEAQKWVDSAISKTINMPNDVSWSDFVDVYLRAYEGGAKGCTVYRAGAGRGAVLRKVEETVCTVDPVTGAKSCE